MIECSNCETAQHLTITASRVHFDDPVRADTIDEVTEAYECIACGGTGKYCTTPAIGVTLTGDIEETDNRPTGTVWDLSNKAGRSPGHTQANP